jgi:Cof subfamily protein (haloacid dehalogenase superfamily)
MRPGRGRLPSIVATDLDGTLVRSDQTVSSYTHHVLSRVRAAGSLVVGVTGRGPRLLDLSMRDLGAQPTNGTGAQGYLVCAQGGWVIDLASGEVLASARLDAQAAAEALELLERAAGPVLLTVESGVSVGAPLMGDRGFGWPFPEAWVAADREALLAEPVLKMFASSSRLDVDGLLGVAREAIPSELAEATHAGLGCIEICPPGITKAVGLSVVARHAGVPAADIVAFGDMPNDVPMLSWAGHGVAVANAHAELLAVADEVTERNDDDGVAGYLAKLLEAHTAQTA